MATSNPILLRILTEDLGMSENEAQGHMARNALTLYHHFDNVVTDDILIAISENWPELTSVDLRRADLESRNITDTAVIALATNCAGMTNINLNYCSNVTDAGVIAIAKNCPGLEVISLSMCKNITDAAIIAMAEKCEGLSSIDVSACYNLTDNAVIVLADGCAGLMWISMSMCKNITDAAIIALANCDYLQHCQRVGTKVTATGRALIKEINSRPKPPPLEKGWWMDMDDGREPRCKGMMN